MYEFEHDVFISYKRKDASFFARMFYHKLESKGYSVFMDVEKLGFNQRFRDGLEEAILESRIFMLFLTGYCFDTIADEQDEVRREYEMALKHDLIIFIISDKRDRIPEKLGQSDKEVHKDLLEYNILEYETAHDSSLFNNIFNEIEKCKNYKIHSLSMESLEQLLEYSDSLKDIIEPMSRLSCGNMRNKDGIFSDWAQRINKMGGAPLLQREWNAFIEDKADWYGSDYKRKARRIVEWLKKGLKRDARSSLKIDQKTYQQYEMEDGSDLIVGKRVRISSPCWNKRNSGDVIQKGVLVANSIEN